MQLIDLSSLPVIEGCVHLSPVTDSDYVDLDDQYELLLSNMAEMRSEQDKGMACRDFASDHGLHFLGFHSENHSPLFQK